MKVAHEIFPLFTLQSIDLIDVNACRYSGILNVI